MKSIKTLCKKYSIAVLIKKFDDRCGLQFIIRKLTSHWFNPFATLYVNFFSFPFSQAIKLPMFVYGSPGIYHVVGNMQIIGKVYPGMIRFNQTKPLNSSHQLSNSELSNLGLIIFHGKATIGCGSRILIQKNAILELGDSVILADHINLGCHYHISIGDNTRITHRSQIQESNHHFIINTANYTISPCTRPISIGCGCWICNNSTINAGTIIPDHCIIASNSLVNGGKSIKEALPGSIIGGIPAKVISQGEKYRIFNKKWESILFQWFAEHPNEVYSVPIDTPIENLTNP